MRWPELPLDGSYGATLLLVAMEVQAWETFDTLLELGANPTIADPKGKVPLDVFDVPESHALPEHQQSYQRLKAAAARFSRSK